MKECFDGKPENRIDLFWLFDQTVTLASDEEILSSFEKYFDEKVTLRRFLPMTVLSFEIGDATLLLREFSIVKKFDKDPYSYERKPGHKELKINQRAKFYVSYRETIDFLPNEWKAEAEREKAERIMFRIRLKWLLAMCETYPSCIGMFFKAPYEGIMTIDELRELGRQEWACANKANYDASYCDFAQNFFQEHGHYPTEGDVARLVDEARKETREGKNDT